MSERIRRLGNITLEKLNVPQTVFVEAEVVPGCGGYVEKDYKLDLTDYFLQKPNTVTQYFTRRELWQLCEALFAMLCDGQAECLCKDRKSPECPACVWSSEELSKG